MSRARIAVTLGDPRGIGPEVVGRALEEVGGADITAVGPPPHLLERLAVARRIPVGVWDAAAGEGAGAEARERALRAGSLAGRAIETAARLALAGQVDALVTAPIDKHATRLAGYPYPGHTEWLAHLAGDVEVAMMLTTEAATNAPPAATLRVVLLTTHVPLRDVPTLLTVERVTRIGRVTEVALRRWWGLEQPRLVLCALNPHAGEHGLFGDEEERVLRPAAQALHAAGPAPADTVFVRALRGEFDVVLAPYHDVGMTAIKVAAFGRAVNVTLGLPFPRTSPDHGTALDIAGQGKANPASMVAALQLAVELAARTGGKS